MKPPGFLKRDARRGYVNVLDSLVALVFFSLIFTIVVSVYEPVGSSISAAEFKSIHYLSEDVLDVLNKQGVLDDVGTEWAAANGSNASAEWIYAANQTKGYLDSLLPERYGYKLVIDETNLIYSSDSDNESGRPKEADKGTETHSSRLLVGYGRGLPTRGHVARAFLTNIREKVTSSYAYFGGFEGQGNLTKKLTLPSGTDTVQSICIEYNAGDDYTISIDGNDVPDVFPGSGMNMSANYQCIADPQNYIPAGGAGTHDFVISFTGGDMRYAYMAGGFIKVTYNTSQFDTSAETGKTRFEFPGINGIMNLYSSFYVPGTLNQMKTYLRFNNNYTTYLTIGDTKVFDSKSNASRAFCSITGSEYTCNIPDANMSQMLANAGMSYSYDLSEQTIPLRMGVDNISGNYTLGKADVILITDLSGSMNWRVGYNNETYGQERDCDNALLYSNDTRRVSLAKCLDKDFVDTILNTSGSRVGLVGFTDNADDSDYNHVLSSDKNGLTDTINGYPDDPSGGTCICCAINRAMQLLSETVDVIPQGSADWIYKRYNSCNSGCDPATIPFSCNHVGWYDVSIDESSWSDTNMPYVSSTWNSRVGYFRKHFTLTAPVSNATLYVRNKRGVECYLNGQLVGRDASCETGNYWDNSWTIEGSVFNVPGSDNVLACRLRTQGQGFAGIEFDVKMVAEKNMTNNKYIILMTDGIAGYSCGNCGRSGSCSCSGTCTATSGTSVCGGNPSDCTGTQCDRAIDDAVCAARRAYTTNGIHVYTVGFGPVANCTNGRKTLVDAAGCGNATYYGSSDARELQDMYRMIAESIINATYQSQTVDVYGDVAPSRLYPESYIEFAYTPPKNYSNYGEISLTQNTERFNESSNCTGNLITPAIATVSDVKVTSYSGEHWADYLEFNGLPSPVYTLRDRHYGENYVLIGDPYIIQIPPSLVQAGQNNSIYLETGDGPDPPYTGCSSDNRAIYTVRLVSRVSYGDVFLERNGCNWTVQFEDGSNLTEMIPLDYNGTKKCTYSQYNVSYDTNDAIDDSIYRLLQRLDSNANNKIEIKFDPSMIEFDFSRSGGVQSLWGPISMKLIVWMRK